MNSACIARLNKELRNLEMEPPPGISAWPKDGAINVLEALILGPSSTPYEGGTFKLEVKVPNNYPFEPPAIRFITPIYHPNIDSGGRICLDTLNMPPKGEWKPAVNLSTVLTTIQLLMAEPNPDDGLMADITQEFKVNRAKFEANARAHTRRHAVDTSNATLNVTQPAECGILSSSARKDESAHDRHVHSSSSSQSVNQRPPTKTSPPDILPIAVTPARTPHSRHHQGAAPPAARRAQEETQQEEEEESESDDDDEDHDAKAASLWGLDPGPARGQRAAPQHAVTGAAHARAPPSPTHRPAAAAAASHPAAVTDGATAAAAAAEEEEEVVEDSDPGGDSDGDDSDCGMFKRSILAGAGTRRRRPRAAASACQGAAPMNRSAAHWQAAPARGRPWAASLGSGRVTRGSDATGGRLPSESVARAAAGPGPARGRTRGG